MTSATMPPVSGDLRQNWLRSLPAHKRFLHYMPDERPPAECWIWRGPMISEGYGTIAEGPIKHLAHRYVYEQLVGPIPDGMQIDHTCFVRACVNPAHLEPVTQQENLRRSGPRRHKTHCRHGHELTTENLYVNRDGRRECRVCRRVRRRRFYDEKGS